MMNQAFILQSQEEQQKKLTTILRSCTNDALTCEEIRNLTLSVALNRQYAITVHITPLSFRKALVLVRSDERDDCGKIVFGQALFSITDKDGGMSGELFKESASAAAIVARKTRSAEAEKSQYAIHIYVPQQLFKKGMKGSHEQRFQKTCGV